MGNTELNFLDLVSRLREQLGHPTNKMVVLASLESHGYSDEDAVNDYGYRNLYDLAESVFEDLQTEKQSSFIAQDGQKDRSRRSADLIPVSDYLWTRTTLFVQKYPQGLFHLLPILVQIAAIVFFGYSLWAYLGFNIVQSTAVVLGVILGLVGSGGFIQVMGRQASFYWHSQEFGKCRETIYKTLKAGFMVFSVSFLLILLLNFLLSLYPLYFTAVSLIYAMLIGILLMICAPFHTIEKRWVISMIITIATLFALYLNVYTSLHVYYTHWLGILSGIAIGIIALRFYLGKMVKKNSGSGNYVNPMMIISKNYHLFAYGTLVYVFIFIDRVLAWSTDTGLTHDYFLLYEKNYEIGMDMAIILFFLLAGVMEYAIASFNKFLNQGQESLELESLQLFNRKFRKLYAEHIFWLFITAVGASWIIYLLVIKPWGYLAVFGEPMPVISLWICIAGGIGYFFLAWGMLNALYMFTLNRYKESLQLLVYASLINFAAGIVLSRLISYEFSVLGMLLGSVFFAVATNRACLKFFKNLDYHYYAAY